MPVMLIAMIPGSTSEQQQSFYDSFGGQLVEQDGFLSHAAGPTSDGWRLYETWETRQQLGAWLEGTIFPALPDDAPEPQMEIVDIEVVLEP